MINGWPLPNSLHGRSLYCETQVDVDLWFFWFSACELHCLSGTPISVHCVLRLMLFKKFGSSDVSSVGPVKSSVARGIRGAKPCIQYWLVNIFPNCRRGLAPRRLLSKVSSRIFKIQYFSGKKTIHYLCSCAVRKLSIPGRYRPYRCAHPEERNPSNSEMVRHIE